MTRQRTTGRRRSVVVLLLFAVAGFLSLVGDFAVELLGGVVSEDWVEEHRTLLMAAVAVVAVGGVVAALLLWLAERNDQGKPVAILAGQRGDLRGGSGPPYTQPHVGRQASAPDGGSDTLTAHRTILAVDIKDYSERRNLVQAELRQTLRTLLRRALLRAGATDEHCTYFDTGDGFLVMIVPEVEKFRLLSPLLPWLAAALSNVNAKADAEARMQLRMALHAGDVVYDEKTLIGDTVNEAGRMLDAAALRRPLDDPQVPLAVLVSDWIFRQVVWHGYGGVDRSTYERVPVDVGTLRTFGYLHVPVPAAGADTTEPMPDPTSSTLPAMARPSPAPTEHASLARPAWPSSTSHAMTAATRWDAAAAWFGERRLILAGVATAVLLSVSMAGPVPSEPLPSDVAPVVRLGFFGPLTGGSQKIGTSMRNGAMLAIERHNRTSDVEVQLLSYDTQDGGVATEAETLARKAVRDGVIGVIGPAFTPESLAAVPILDRAGVATITPAARAPVLASRGWSHWHRALANETALAPETARFIAKNLRADHVLVLHDGRSANTRLADTVSNALRRERVQVAIAPINPSQPSHPGVLKLARKQQIDAVFYSGYPEETAKLLHEFQAAKLRARFVASEGALDPRFVRLAGKLVTAVFFTCTCSYSTVSDVGLEQEFIDSYRKAYGHDPGSYAAEAYDAATAFLRAIEAGSMRPDLIGAHLDADAFTGVSKPIAFDGSGELADARVYVHRFTADGKLAVYGDVDSLIQG